LHAQTTGWESELFAPNATKIQVELDEAVMAREQVNVNYKIYAGSLEFIKALWSLQVPDRARENWLSRCNSWKQRYPVHLEAHDRVCGAINYYYFADVLSEATNDPITVVADAGTSFYVMGQALRLKRGQRFISSGSMGAMGFALPAANGVAVAAGTGTMATICVTGDGSLMTNVHELATMRKNNLNVKLFVMNNEGYVSMRNTQNEYCGGRLIGADSTSGVFIPCLESLAELYNIPFVRCSQEDELAIAIKKVMSIDGPVFCEVITAHNQKIIPTVASIKMLDGRMQSTQIHNMSPLLSDEIMKQELLIESSSKDQRLI
jgi:acetolactate synthase-1/2/3 large subunit